MKTKWLILFILILSIFFSCQKEGKKGTENSIKTFSISDFKSSDTLQLKFVDSLDINLCYDMKFNDSLLYFVDPNALMNPDGTISVFLMNQEGGPFPPAGRTGYIYTFTSTDNGQTFHMDKDTNGDAVRFKFDDYDAGYGFSDTVYSLNDPKAVILPDGRYRVYISAMLKDSSGNFRYAIVSATSKLQNSVKNIDYGKYISVYPNPSKGRFVLRNKSGKELSFVVRNIEGKKITRGKVRSEKFIDLSKYQSGAYVVEFISDGYLIFTEKIFIVK